MLFVDAMNVIGSRPDGWWKDRDGAMRRLVDDVRRWATDEVTVVLDSGPEDLIGTVGPLMLVLGAHGRDGADDEIVRRVQPGDTVVTSDRALAARVRKCGATVEGAGAFRARLTSSP